MDIFMLRAALVRENDANDAHKKHGSQAAQEADSKGQEEEQHQWQARTRRGLRRFRFHQ